MALPPLVGDGEAHGLDAPLGHPVHAPHEEALCCGSRGCLNVKNRNRVNSAGAAKCGGFVSRATDFPTSETSQPRTGKPVLCTEQLTVTGSPNLQREGDGDLKATGQSDLCSTLQ